MIRPEENAEQTLSEKMMETAYGLETVGLPIQGIESNAQNITAEMVNKFYLEKFTADKILLCASGVKNHQEFVKMVEERLDKITLGNSVTKRNSAVYKGGINKIYLDREEFHATLLFQSVNLFYYRDI